MLLSAVAGALAIAPAAPAAAKQPLGVQVLGIGAGVSGARVDADLAQAGALGAHFVRADVDWASLEPSEGAYDPGVLATADHLFAGARARGMKVLLDVVGTPCWNTTAPAPASDCSSLDERVEARRFQPRDLDAYARMAAFAAARWQRDLVAMELWNEPDQANQQYWAGPDKVRRYAELVRSAYKAIKAASPSTQVLAGALVGGNGKFLEALYAAGMKGSYDGLSLHFYDLALFQLGEIRGVLRRHDDHVPMWLAETGFTSCLGHGTRRQLGGHLCVTPGNQARFTIDVLRELRRQRDVRGVSIFELRDNETYDFGVLDRSGARKPLFAALRRAYGGHLGKARRTTVRVRARGGRAVVSGSAPAGDAYILEVAVAGRLRYRAVFRLDRDGRFSLRVPAVVGTRALTARVRPYTVRRAPVSARLR